jgi:hypothetical protein
MTPERIEKAKWLSELYAAVANGEELQVWKSDTDEWRDATSGPNLSTIEKGWWRIKPKPRRFWVLLNEDGEIVDTTRHQARANAWRIAKNYVIEVVGVLP